MVGRRCRLILLACAAMSGHAGSANARSKQRGPSTAQPSTAQPSTAQPSTAQPSTAQPSTASFAPLTRLRLEHAAPSSCPGADELLARVAIRVTAAERGERGVPEPPALVARVRILRAATGYDGHVELVGREQRTLRAVKGSSCDEVTSALAVIIGLALDAHADSGGHEPAPPRAATTTGAAHFGLGLGAMLHSAPTPEPLVGGLLMLTLDRRRGWAPAVSFTLGWGRSDPVESPDGGARFALTLGSLALCPWRWTPHPRLAAGPCVRLDLGALRGWGSGAEVNHRSIGTWVAPGATLDWALGLERLLLGASGGFALPLVQDRFVLRDRGGSTRDRLLHEPAPVDVRAEIWAAWAIGK